MEQHIFSSELNLCVPLQQGCATEQQGHGTYIVIIAAMPLTTHVLVLLY
jgi:hypothetical protein